jgi:hypothetical protein
VEKRANDSAAEKLRLLNEAASLAAMRTDAAEPVIIKAHTRKVGS